MKDELKELSLLGKLRTLKLPEDDLVDFCSNDYLGLAKEVFLFENEESGSSGSRLLTGNSIQTEQLEQQLADFFNAHAALLFGSGYLANLGLLSAIAKRNDVLLYDKLVHASIRDGCRLSHAKSFGFDHNDLADLQRLLEKNGESTVFVIVESVYSMDGDGPDLMVLNTLVKKHSAYLIVDEAHAVGTCGKNNSGKGLVNYHGLESNVFARIVTFGKSMGCDGAVVLGSYELRNYLINFSRSFIYTTSLSPIRTALIDHQLKRMQQMDDLNKNASFLKLFFLDKANKRWTILTGDHGNIIAIVMPENDRVKTASNELRQYGYDIRPILSPTVEKGTERLRICFHEFNTLNETKGLLTALEEVLK